MRRTNTLLASLVSLSLLAAACSGGGDDPPATTTYSISGTITGATSVTVNLGGAATTSTTTDTSGNYSFTGLANGGYTVTPSKTGSQFDPASRDVTINGANVTGQNFSASAATYAISGTVTSGGSPLAGVLVTMSGAASGTKTTDAFGNYSFTGLSSGSYDLVPSKTGYAFNPLSTAVTINGASATGKNFVGTAAATTYTLSGNVATALDGVLITLTGNSTGTSSGTKTTSGGGNYSFAGLVAGDYTIAATKAGYNISPSSQSLTVSANTTQNFIATPIPRVISGTVTGAGGAPISGVTVNLTGSDTQSDTTDTSGAYSFTVAAGTYTLMPSKTGYAFTPSSRSNVTVSNADVTGQNFAATVSSTYTIAGTIGGAWGEDVTVTLQQSGSSTVLQTKKTAADGTYSFTGLANEAYVVTPSLPGYSYSPAAPTVTLGGANKVQDFTAYSSMTSYSITGSITYSGSKSGKVYVYAHSSTCMSCNAYAGTSVQLNGTGSATSVQYTVRGLAAGTYALSAGMDTGDRGAQNAADPVGEPTSNVTITSANVTGANFTITDPSTTPTADAVTPYAFAGNGVVLVAWDPLVNSDDVEAATSYDLAWGNDATTPNLVSVPAQDDTHYILPASNGSTVYVKLRSKVGSTAGAWSSVIQADVGAVTDSGTYAVSGTVSFSGTATGPLYVAIEDQVNGALRLSRYGSAGTPPTFPVTYSVTGNATGNQFVYTILDQNADGQIDDGDVRLGEPLTVAGATTKNLVLDASASYARTRTQHGKDVSGTGEWYSLGNTVEDNTKRAVRVVLFSGPGLPVPVDMPREEEHRLWSNGSSTAPTVGSTYKYKAFYADGTSAILSSTVTAVLNTFPTNLTTSTASPYSAAQPLFQWTAPSPLPTFSYGYRVELWGGSAGWWRDTTLPSSTTSVEWNDDGNGWPWSLPAGTYTWSVSVEDANGNTAKRQATYTVP